MSLGYPLSRKTCLSDKENVYALKGESLAKLYSQLNQNWKIVDDHHLEREFLFKDFQEALTFTNLIGEIAEQEHHHPDIVLSYGKVKILLWTHKINGLSENDFILAAKFDMVK